MTLRKAFKSSHHLGFNSSIINNISSSLTSTMATKLRQLSLQGAVRTATSRTSRQQRHFASTSKCLTDGVYGELTAMRTRTPFIEAFRKQQEGSQSTATAESAGEKVPINTDPKRMSESFHKVVSICRVIFWRAIIDASIDPASCA